MKINPDSFPDDPIRRLEAIMAVLRGPDGCPWDREQDHRSLRTNLLEETYEVLDILDGDEEVDVTRLVEELGDLLLQIIFHAQLGSERSEFDLDQIASVINEKLIRRHPHVFDATEVSGTGEVLRNWEHLKLEEGKESALDGVPASLPALQKAALLISKARRAGFRWESPDQALAKAWEEWQEFEKALADIEEDRRDTIGEVEREFGDLLFALVNCALESGVDPEASFREATLRFEKRFRHMEKKLSESGERLENLDIDTLVDEWRISRDGDTAQGASMYPDS